MIEMIEKQRKQMYSQMDNLIAKKQKRKQEWFTTYNLCGFIYSKISGFKMNWISFLTGVY